MRRFWHANQGSITLEATIVFPLLIGVIILLINLIRITSIYLVMDHAVSETVKQIATHSYPLKLVRGAAANSSASDGSPSFSELTGLMKSIPGNQGKDVVTGGSDISGDIIGAVSGAVSDAVLTEAVRAVAAARIKELYARSGIGEADLRITGCKVYNPNSDKERPVNEVLLDQEDVALSVEYNIKLPVPFLPLKRVTMSNTAVERAWADD